MQWKLVVMRRILLVCIDISFSLPSSYESYFHIVRSIHISEYLLQILILTTLVMIKSFNTRFRDINFANREEPYKCFANKTSNRR